MRGINLLLQMPGTLSRFNKDGHLPCQLLSNAENPPSNCSEVDYLCTEPIEWQENATNPAICDKGRYALALQLLHSFWGAGGGGSCGECVVL